MHACSMMLMAAAMGVDTGWQPLDDGGMEYIVQIQPELFDSLRNGESITSKVPDNVHSVRSFKIVVGKGQLPRVAAPVQRVGNNAFDQPRINARDDSHAHSHDQSKPTRSEPIRDDRYTQPLPSPSRARSPATTLPLERPRNQPLDSSSTPLNRSRDRDRLFDSPAPELPDLPALPSLPARARDRARDLDHSHPALPSLPARARDRARDLDHSHAETKTSTVPFRVDPSATIGRDRYPRESTSNDPRLELPAMPRRYSSPPPTINRGASNAPTLLLDGPRRSESYESNKTFTESSGVLTPPLSATNVSGVVKTVKTAAIPATIPDSPGLASWFAVVALLAGSLIGNFYLSFIWLATRRRFHALIRDRKLAV